MNNQQQPRGITFMDLLLLMLVGLKLTGHITCSWWWVFVPIWGPVVAALCLAIVMTALRSGG